MVNAKRTRRVRKKIGSAVVDMLEFPAEVALDVPKGYADWQSTFIGGKP